MAAIVPYQPIARHDKTTTKKSQQNVVGCRCSALINSLRAVNYDRETIIHDSKPLKKIIDTYVALFGHSKMEAVSKRLGGSGDMKNGDNRDQC